MTIGPLSRVNMPRCLMTRPTKLGRLTGIAAAAMIAALDFTATMLAPTPAEAGVFVGFGFGFPIGFPGSYLSAISVLRAATATLLSSARLLSAATGLVSAVRRVSVLSRPRAIGVGRDTTNHLHASPRLDQCGRSILPGIQIEPGRWQSCDREVRHRLSRRERPVAYRQLTEPDDDIAGFLAGGGRALDNRRKG